MHPEQRHKKNCLVRQWIVCLMHVKRLAMRPLTPSPERQVTCAEAFGRRPCVFEFCATWELHDAVGDGDCRQVSALNPVTSELLPCASSKHSHPSTSTQVAPEAQSHQQATFQPRPRGHAHLSLCLGSPRGPRSTAAGRGEEAECTARRDSCSAVGDCYCCSCCVDAHRAPPSLDHHCQFVQEALSIHDHSGSQILQDGTSVWDLPLAQSQ